jgi:uncharacterized membrane protein YkvA (DUF1232 family)
MPVRKRRMPWARTLGAEFRALAIAMLDPRVPWRSKLVVGGAIGYALWPFDLIPDVVPFVGWLDDLVIVPLGLWIAARLVPAGAMADARRKVARRSSEQR